MEMKKALTYSLVAFAAIAVGAASGIIAKRVLGSEEIDYGELNFNDMKPDCDAIIKKIDSYNGSKEVVEAFSASDIFNYSMEKFRRCDNNYSFSIGVADTIIKQDIKSCTIKNRDNYFEESVSKSSMVAVANRMYQNGVDGDVDLYPANKDSINLNKTTIDANYDVSKKTTLGHDDYAAKYGKTIDEVFIYLVVDKTLKESSVTKLENNYRIEMKLDPDLSTYFYKYQMKAISNLDKYPVFESVSITYEVDKKLSLTKLSIDEKYKATMVVEASIHGTMDTFFFPNKVLSIPELNEQIIYSQGE